MSERGLTALLHGARDPALAVSFTAVSGAGAEMESLVVRMVRCGSGETASSCCVGLLRRADLEVTDAMKPFLLCGEAGVSSACGRT